MCTGRVSCMCAQLWGWNDRWFVLVRFGRRKGVNGYGCWRCVVASLASSFSFGSSQHISQIDAGALRFGCVQASIPQGCWNVTVRVPALKSALRLYFAAPTKGERSLCQRVRIKTGQPRLSIWTLHTLSWDSRGSHLREVSGADVGMQFQDQAWRVLSRGRGVACSIWAIPCLVVLQQSQQQLCCRVDLPELVHSLFWRRQSSRPLGGKQGKGMAMQDPSELCTC